MKNLNINVISSHEEIIWGLRSYIGEIIIDGYKETFEMPVEFWTLEDYKKQWAEGLEKIKIENKSCLVARIEGENGKPSQIEWWLLYRKDKKIFIRNQLMLSDNLKEYVGDHPFTPENCYQFIKPMSRSKEVSTWIVDLD